MTLWNLFKLWWAYRRMKRYGQIGDFMVIPPEATVYEKRVVPGSDDPLDTVHTIGWKLTLCPHCEQLCGRLSDHQVNCGGFAFRP